MGDFFLTHDQTGRAYLRRLFYCNILIYVLMAVFVVVYLVDIIILILVVALTAIASLIYALYFVLRNPPISLD